ncbi:MAG: DUF2889 domain-containing protein [Bacillota bacterium]
MHCLLQRNWHLSVRMETKKLLSEVTYCGTDGEYCARLLVQPQSFLVLNAQWEVYRTPEGAVDKIMELPQLCGLEVYFNSGPALREALSTLQDSYAASLFADAVRAVIQSETFLYRERGFHSTAAYDEYWNTNFLNSCRFYSNLDRVSCKWYDHVGIDHRSGNLFNRMKSQFLYSTANGYRLNGHLNDSFHGVFSELELAGDGSTVIKARGDLLRAPDAVCQESVLYMQELEGKSLGGLKKRDMAELLGSHEGCVHLFETVFDSMETLKLYRDLQTKTGA